MIFFLEKAGTYVILYPRKKKNTNECEILPTKTFGKKTYL
jgi:hypothetical protein